MEKTEMMKWYEAETGEILDIDHLSADANGSWYGYIDELEAELRGLNLLNKWSKEELIKYQSKATAYDRLMSGGRKTLKEWANFLGTNIAINNNGDGVVSVNPLEFITLSDGYKIAGYWSVRPGYPYTIFNIPSYLIDYTGDWKDSLTLPDGWEG